MTTRILDRRVSFDERSRQYPIRELLTTTRPRSYTWSVGTWLDQGTEGACVGFAWAHERAARPVARPATETDARALYRHAQTLDEWPGENYDGTSVLAGAKASTARGWLTEYRWAFNLNDALAAISRHGPCVLGIDWYTGMFDPDPDGFLHPDGPLAGGHAILAVGVNVNRRTVTLHNSWGRGWGVDGKAKLSWDDLGFLLSEQGECCVPVRR